MKTVRNIVGLLFLGLAIVTSEAHPRAYPTGCGASSYNQIGNLCYEEKECGWDAGENFTLASETFELQNYSPACVAFHQITFRWFLDYTFGNNWEYYALQCNDYCFVGPPPWNPFYHGCGTYGTFRVYQEYVGTCPQ